ncbi:unnamed protein product [Fraxinus pennsylvanica]|uniref:Pentatricopeptide repeat-containing protein n=1 Tax=Fraxinus pennsylvanica TaxID=56036 RepID=A0AAD1ZCV9_9LAMI|nr:unnamed protein product [Fraxinus pennsylvanica]
MKRESTVGPDKYTFPSLIKACSNANALREGRIIHGLSVRYGTEGDVFVGSSLIDLYGKCEEINSARKVFDGMSVTNEVSWTAMMVGYLNSGDLFKAKYLFDEMPVKSLVTWNAMIKGLVRLGELKSARTLFDKMPERNKVSFTTMIDGYAKAGDMAAARFSLHPPPFCLEDSESLPQPKNKSPNNQVELGLLEDIFIINEGIASKKGDILLCSEAPNFGPCCKKGSIFYKFHVDVVQKAFLILMAWLGQHGSSLMGPL